MFLLATEPPEGTRTFLWSLWLSLLSAYMFAGDALTSAGVFVLNRLLPDLLGLSSADVPRLPWILSALRWRSPISGAFLALSLVLLLAASASRVAREFEYEQPAFYLNGRTLIQTRLSTNVAPVDRVAWRLAGAFLRLSLLTFVAMLFSAQVARVSFESILKLLRETLRYSWQLVRYLGTPLIAFSALACAVLFMLTQYEAYRLGTPISPWILWGEVVTVFVMALVLCGAAFGFAPSGGRRFLSASTEAVLLVGSFFGFLLSIASLAFPLLWWSFTRVDIAIPELRPGPLYYLNLAAVTFVLLGVVTLLLLLQRRPRSVWRSRFQLFVVVLAVIPVGVGLGTGGIPLLRGLINAAT